MQSNGQRVQSVLSFPVGALQDPDQKLPQASSTKSSQKRRSSDTPGAFGFSIAQQRSTK